MLFFMFLINEIDHKIFSMYNIRYCSRFYLHSIRDSIRDLEKKMTRSQKIVSRNLIWSCNISIQRSDMLYRFFT